MTILQKLINAMLQRIEAVPVPQQELDDFLAQNQIRLCPEHYRFILDYGNSPFLINWFANLSFDEFKDYYSDKELLPDSVLPANCDFIGLDFSDDTLCLDRNTQKIHTFGYGEIDEGFQYGGLSELLFYCLFRSSGFSKCFDNVQCDPVTGCDIRITDIEQFKKEYSDDEIKNIHIYDRFFFKDGRLVVCDHKFYSYFIYEGGVLGQLA